MTAAGLVALPGAAQAAFDPWQRVHSPRPSGGFGVWFDSAAVSDSDAWMVGDDEGGGPPAFIAHWNGRAWHRQDAPAGMAAIGSVSAVSSNDVWAAALCGSKGSACVIRYNGSRWRRAGRILGSFSSASIAARGPDDVWLLMSGSNPVTGAATSYAYHWNGSSWTAGRLPGVRGTQVTDVTWVPGSEQFFACGLRYNGFVANTALWHFVGGRWQVVPQQASADSDEILYSVTATSPQNAWAVGDVNQYRPLVERLTPEGWRRTSTPPLPHPRASEGAGLSGVASSGPNDVWAVGIDDRDDEIANTLLAHFDGSSWRTYEIPEEWAIGTAGYADTVVHVPNSPHYWAGGSFYTSTLPHGQNQAMILRK